jgi:phosphoglycolate phosphatase
VSRNIILDWSGTVVDDLKPVLEATNAIFRHFGRPEMPLDEFRREFRLPFPAFYSEHIPEATLEGLDELYERFFLGLQTKVDLLSGAGEFLEFCRRTKRRVFLLSTIKESHYQAQAKRLGLLPYFERAYVQIMDKREKIGDLLEENGLDPAETLFVGDMVHDIETARFAGVMGVATLTGFDPIAKLAEARPDLIVRDLFQLQRLLGNGLGPTPASRPGADAIVVSRMKVSAEIGVTEEERSVPQDLEVFLTLKPEAAFSGLEDDLDRAVDYADVCLTIQKLTGSRPRNLIETLAEDLAETLLRRYPLAEVEVEVRKFVIPQAGYVGVRISRARSGEVSG